MHSADHATEPVVDDAMATLTELLDTDDLFTDDALALAEAVVKIGNLDLVPGEIAALADLAVEIGTVASLDTQDATAALRRVARRHQVPARTKLLNLHQQWKRRPKGRPMTESLYHFRILEPVVTADHRHFITVHTNVLQRLRPRVLARWAYRIRWPQQ